MEVKFVRKRISIICCLSILITMLSSSAITFAKVNIPAKSYNIPYRPPTGSNEELYKDIFIAQLDPCIRKAIQNYYRKPYNYDPWDVDIIDIKRPYGDRTPFFIIKLQILPYVGAHNTVGIDILTVNVSIGQECKIEKFEHTKN